MISLIMATYNNEREISLAIASVLAQDYTDWELLVVNDASTDATPAILRDFAARDRRVMVLDNERNLGRVLSRNRAIEKARGEFIAVLDADDVALPDRLSRQAAYLLDQPEVGILGGWAIAIDARNEPLEPLQRPTTDAEIRRHLRQLRMPFVHSTVMFRRELGLALGLYDPRFAASEDFHFCYRYVQAARAASLPEFLVLYRIQKSPPPGLVRRRYRWSSRVGWDLFKRQPNLMAGASLLRMLVLSWLPGSVAARQTGVYKGRWNQRLLTEEQVELVENWIRRLELQNQLFTG